MRRFSFLPTFICLFVFIFTMAFTVPSLAIESPWSTQDDMQIRLLGSNDALSREAGYRAAVQIRLGSGWHTYWRSSGESGLPPRFNWSGSSNLSAAETLFLFPKRYDEMGMTTFGYEGDFMLPLLIQAADKTLPVTLDLNLNAMICRDICIPVTFRSQLEIPAEPQENSMHTPLIIHAHSRAPAQGNINTLKIENTTLTKEKLAIAAYSQRGFNQAELIVEIDGVALDSAATIEQRGDNRNEAILSLDIPEDIRALYEDAESPFAGAGIILSLSNGRDAIEYRIDGL